MRNIFIPEILNFISRDVDGHRKTKKKMKVQEYEKTVFSYTDVLMNRK